MTNNFPFVQCEQPRLLSLFFTATHWIRAGNIQTVEKNLSMLQTCFSLAHLWPEMLLSYPKLRIRNLNVTNHHLQTYD